VKFYIAGFYEYMSRKSKFGYIRAKMWGILHVGFILLGVTHMAYQQYRRKLTVDSVIWLQNNSSTMP